MLLYPYSWFLGAPTDLQLGPHAEKSTLLFLPSSSPQNAVVAFVPTAGKAHGDGCPEGRAKGMGITGDGNHFLLTKPL